MAAIMKRIDVFELSRKGASVSENLAPGLLERLAPALARLAGEIEYTFLGGIDERGRPAAVLQLRARLPLRCDRCRAELDFALEAQQHYYFVASERELARIPVEVGDDEALLGSAAFDLRGLVEDELILRLPISPRHPDCQPPVALPAAATGDGGEGTRERLQPFAALAGLGSRRGGESKS